MFITDLPQFHRHPFMRIQEETVHATRPVGVTKVGIVSRFVALGDTELQFSSC